MQEMGNGIDAAGNLSADATGPGTSSSAPLSALLGIGPLQEDSPREDAPMTTDDVAVIGTPPCACPGIGSLQEGIENGPGATRTPSMDTTSLGTPLSAPSGLEPLQ